MKRLILNSLEGLKRKYSYECLRQVSYCRDEIRGIANQYRMRGLDDEVVEQKIGNYLDEAYIIDLIKNKEFEQLKEMRDGWTYAYLGGWILISTLGIYWQCRNKSKRQKMGSYKALK